MTSNSGQCCHFDCDTKLLDMHGDVLYSDAERVSKLDTIVETTTFACLAAISKQHISVIDTAMLSIHVRIHILPRPKCGQSIPANMRTTTFAGHVLQP